MTTSQGAVPPDLDSPKKSRRSRHTFGSVKQRAGKPGWYVAFTWHGKSYLRVAGLDRRVAERNLTRVHALLMDGKAIGEALSEVFGEPHGARLTFRDAAPLCLGFARTRKRPSTWKTDVDRARLLREAPWATQFLAFITPQDITRWIDECRKAGTSGATLNRYLALGSALFKWAIRQGYVGDNPFRGVERFKESKGREVYLTAEESRALVNVAAPALRPIIVCALSTGMRRGELLSLKWRDLDLARREILIRAENEKAGRGRALPMTEDLYRELLAARAARKVLALDGTAPVFTYEDGTPVDERGLRSLFDSAVERCGAIPIDKRGDVTFHTLRHTAASLMVQAGVSLFEVGKILGHSTPSVTMRYAHFAPEAGRSAIDRLGKTLSIGGTAGEAGARLATGTGRSPLVSDPGKGPSGSPNS